MSSVSALRTNPFAGSTSAATALDHNADAVNEINLVNAARAGYVGASKAALRSIAGMTAVMLFRLQVQDTPLKASAPLLSKQIDGADDIAKVARTVREYVALAKGAAEKFDARGFRVMEFATCGEAVDSVTDALVSAYGNLDGMRAAFKRSGAKAKADPNVVKSAMRLAPHADAETARAVLRIFAVKALAVSANASGEVPVEAAASILDTVREMLADAEARFAALRAANPADGTLLLNVPTVADIVDNLLSGIAAESAE